VSDLVEFLKSLTDPRVKNQSAPFDHPELYVANGEQTDAAGDVMTQNGRAVDCFRQVPATGAGGGAPLPTFPNAGGACQDAPDLHNPAPVPHPAPAAPAAPVASAAPAAAPAAPAANVQGSVAGSPARCVVPGLRGRTGAQAKRMLSKAKCRLGVVLQARHTRGRLVVSSQRPSAGARRTAGTRVAVRVRKKK